MASRVNIKFVVLLAIVLVVAASGTAFLGYKVVVKTAEDLAGLGDQKMTEGEFKAAELFYSKAVNKDPYNSLYLLKWREALEQWVPETDRELQTEFSNTYRRLLNQLALSDNMSHFEYQIENLELITKLVQDQGFNRRALESIASDAKRYIERYIDSVGPDRADAPELVTLMRFRGLALSQIARKGLDLTPAQKSQTDADFAAALAADPGDYEVLESVVAMKQIVLTRAVQSGRISETERLRTEIATTLNGFIDANGTDSLPGILATMLVAQGDLNTAKREAIYEYGTGAAPVIEKLVVEFQLTTEQLAEQLAGIDPALLDIDALRRLYALESQTNWDADYRATLPLVITAIDRNPDTAKLALLMADIRATRGEYQLAVDTLDGLLNTPRLPLGLPAWQRANTRLIAAANTANYALRAQAAAEDEEVKNGWIDRAITARDLLTQMIPEAAPAVQLLNAKIAVASGDYLNAQNLLDKHNLNTNNSNREALWLTAQVAQRLRQSGKAKAALEQLLVLNPGETSAHVALADVELTLNHPETALEHLRIAQESNPDDAALKIRITELEKRIDPSRATDPIEIAVLEARRLAAGSESEIADLAAGIERLTRAIEELGDNPELYAEKTRFQMFTGDTDSATETIETAIALFPEDEALQEWQAFVAGSVSVDSRVEMILASDVPEINKQLSIARAYTREGRDDEAAEAFARAEAIDPNNPILIELLFGQAFNAGDLDRARVLAERAQAANTDQINGLSYRARVLMLEGKSDDALAALGQAVQQSPNNTSLWRILANLQLKMGRAADAIGSYQKALAIKPDDVNTILAYCGGLIGLQRYDEALDIARRSESSARNDERFMEMLLGLEARVGDKEGARDRREKILAARPNDTANRLSLIDLYITLGQREEATALIEQTRTLSGQSNLLVQLEARWHAEGNEMEAARRVFARYIAETHPDERTPKYVALAQFMLGKGQSNGGLIALRQAAKADSENRVEINAYLATTLMRYGRNAEAYSILRQLLDDGIPDEDHQIAMQAAEALIGIDRLTDAENLLASIPGAEANITVVLLRSRILLRRGQGQEARAMLDDAVARWPLDYRVWILRAAAEALSPELLEDALADLEQAITIRPDRAEAHRRKAELLVRLGRDDDAIRAWRDALLLNPTLEDLRSALLTTVVRRGLESESIQMAEEWFELRPRDIGLRARIAELFVLGDMQTPAIHILQDAFQIEQHPQIVLRLTDLLLGSDPPRTADAERTLAEARNLVVTEPSLLLARAHVFALTNRLEAARNDCAASFNLTQQRSDAMAFWYGTMVRVFENPQQTLAFLRTLGTQPGGADWASYFAARVMLASSETASAGLTELETVAARTRNGEVKYAALRALSGNRYATEDFEGALTLWKQALQLRPKDWQIENNIAYALAVDLDRPAEALPYAEAASSHAPSKPEVFDTLGTVYLALGRATDALLPLDAAVQLTRGSPSDAKYMTRLAQARLESGDRQGALDLLSQIQALLDTGRELDDQYGAILQKVREGLGQG